MKPFVPTARDRLDVKRSVGLGLTYKEVASLLGITEMTLIKYFKQELAIGASEVNQRVSEKIHSLAMTARDERVQLDASKWITARRFGWSETVKTEVSGPNGGPVNAKVKLVFSGVLADADKNL